MPRPSVRFTRTALCASAAAVVLTWAIFTLRSDGAASPTGHLGGDFPAFYAAGTAVTLGQGASLYAPDVQRALQHRIHRLSFSPDEWLQFAYPAWVAVAYAPLALLPYKAAYVIQVLAMLFALGWACRSTVKLRPALNSHRVALFSGAVLFPPAFIGVFMGQNSVLSLALYLAACEAAVVRKSDAWTGVFLGLLCFKPQIGIPIAALFAGVGMWRSAVVAAATVAVECVIGMWFVDPQWVAKWLAFAADFRASDGVTNASNAVSILGVTLRFIPDGWAIAAGLSAVLAAGFFAGSWTLTGSVPRRVLALTPYGLPAVVLLSPHAMRYEVAAAFAALSGTGPLGLPFVVSITVLALLGQWDGVFGCGALAWVTIRGVLSSKRDVVGTDAAPAPPL